MDGGCEIGGTFLIKPEHDTDDDVRFNFDWIVRNDFEKFNCSICIRKECNILTILRYKIERTII